MSKHLRGFYKDGTTFGMEVDGVRASRVEKKAEYKTRINQYGYKVGTLCIKAPFVASLMGEAAWLITERQDFTHVQFDDGQNIKFSMQEVSHERLQNEESQRRMAQI